MQLRHLIELLDGAVAGDCRREGMNYRPRYTPVMRALITRSPLSVKEIAERAGMTQSATTQTISLMIRKSPLVLESSLEDGRQKVIELTLDGRDLLPRLQACWEVITTAANSLDADLPFPTSQLLDFAIETLATKSFKRGFSLRKRPEKDPIGANLEFSTLELRITAYRYDGGSNDERALLFSHVEKCMLRNLSSLTCNDFTYFTAL